MDVKWVKIRSWHAVAHIGLGADPSITLCGRKAGHELWDDLPAERSCESCLRILARKVDA
jgi:hypothetical protein